MSGRGKSFKTGKPGDVVGNYHGSPEGVQDPTFNPAHDFAEDERAAIANGAPAPAAAQPSGERRPRDAAEEPVHKQRNIMVDVTVEMAWAKIQDIEASHNEKLLCSPLGFVVRRGEGLACETHVFEYCPFRLLCYPATKLLGW